MTTRRTFLLGTAGASAAAALGYAVAPRAESAGDFAVTKTEEEWRDILTEEQYAVLRKEDTEPAFSSPLNEEKREGVYQCAGCDSAPYSSETKYDSGTGWPSFWEPIRPDAVGYKDDWFLVYRRTEVHCARCGGHLGHVFDDGPPPTGKRHCINGVALAFMPAETTTG